jgi:methylmalonyl-CoA/ethylmalonyl-CoA epimerase
MGLPFRFGGFEGMRIANLKSQESDKSVKLHHVGIVTRHFLECVELYKTLGYSQSVVVYDPLQMASIALMQREGEPLIEIIAPEHEHSPAYQWLKRIKAGAYHICYETQSLTEAIALLRAQNFMALAEPVPAVAFENRRVVFLWSALTGLVELVEWVRSADENTHSHTVEAPLLAEI